MKTKPPRTFDYDAKTALLAMQEHKERLKALRPVVPTHRESELDALIEFVEMVQDLVLDDAQPDDDELIRLGLACLRSFPKALATRTRGTDD